MTDRPSTTAPALLLLRLVLGTIMVVHGWQKLTGPGFGGVDEVFAGMGVPVPQLAGPWTLLIELVGGVLMILGAATRVVGLLYAATMAGAIAIVHLKNGFFVSENGYEFALLVGAVALALGVAGAGDLSIDRMLGRGRARGAQTEQVAARPVD